MGNKEMLKIAVCDDEKGVCAELEGMLERIAQRIHVKMEISVWFSGETLRDYLDHGNYFDVIFLDIELMKWTGIDVGSYIRDDLEDVKTQIVYISSKSNYAMRLFKTQPYDFMIKPIMEEELQKVINGILKLSVAKNGLFQYQRGREIFRIDYDDILYFKSHLHKVVIVSKKGETEFYGKLKDVISRAPSQFLEIHKSYLINQNYVVKYAFDFVEMKNQDILTISKAYQKAVRDKLSHRREG